MEPDDAEQANSAGVGYTGYRSCRPLGTHLACMPGGAGADRVSGVKNDSDGSKQYSNNTKTVVVVTVRRVVVVAIRRATIGRVVVPITAGSGWSRRMGPLGRFHRIRNLRASPRTTPARCREACYRP